MRISDSQSSPLVANGVLYLANDNAHLFAFAFNGSPPVFHTTYLPVLRHLVRHER